MSPQNILGVSFCFFLIAWLGTAEKPAFEVVSIKKNNSGNTNSSMGPMGSRFVRF